MKQGVFSRVEFPTSEVRAEMPVLVVPLEADISSPAQAIVQPEPTTFNPFADPLGVLYVLGFAAVGLAAYRTGMRGVIGVLPLWAVAASVLAAGCILVHWAKWGDPRIICPSAVVWAVQGLWLVIVDVLADCAPSLASITPVADPIVVQWSVPVATVGLGAWAVFLNFAVVLKIHKLPFEHMNNVAQAPLKPSSQVEQ